MPDFAKRVNAKQQQALAGEALYAATLVFPPGSSLYSTIARKKGVARAVGGTLGSVASGKVKDRGLEGVASTIPGKWGILALTGSRLLWFEAKPGLSVGPQPHKLLFDWPHEEIRSLDFEEKGLAGYPTFTLNFMDSSTIGLLSEKLHRPHLLGEAWASLHPA